MKVKQPPLIRLVDDDPTVCESLAFVLEVAGLQVKGYSSALDFLAWDDREREGCLLLDVRMPEMTGLELQRRLRTEGVDLPIVFLSAHGDIEMALRAVREGAVDFLVKPPRPETLIPALQKACERHREIRRLKREREEYEAVWATLTEGERETAQLVAKGLTNKEIAGVLDISEEAVKSRRSAMLGKLDVRNAVEVADFLRERERLAAALNPDAGGAA